jgi:tetratricopeptide (TPR) repeat protein
VVTVALMAGTAGRAWAGLAETFQRGNEAFWSGDFNEAIAAYEELVELGVWDSDVFYNLGTSYGRAGQYGRAILNLERALRLNPGDGEAGENLARLRQDLARQRTAAGEDADLEPPRSFWLKFLQRISLAQVALPFLGCYVALFLLLLLRRMTQGEMVRLVSLVVGLVLGALVAAGGVIVGSKLLYERQLREAVAVSGEGVIVREGPGRRFGQSFVARPGDRLRLLEEEGDWLLVRNGGGHEGWGQRGDLEEIGPSTP